MHNVICIYCKEQFDRDKEAAVQISQRRYAHEKCAKKYQEIKTKEELDYEKLEKYITKLFSKDYLTAKIKKQIKDYRHDYNYSFSGMLKTLQWWYEIKDNSINKANEGIGIIPFVYDEAERYFYSLFLSEQYNQNIDYKYEVEEVEIAPPQSFPNPPKLFNFEEMEK